MSFRNFASTFREQASAKAKEAAQKLQTLPTSLPTFDEMAQNDEYIHSEEFNVRGEPKKWKKNENDNENPSSKLQSQHSNQFSGLDEENAVVAAVGRGGGGGAGSIVSSSSSPSSDSNHVPETVSMSIGFGGDEASACTTESSWSLLDRATGAASAAAAAAASTTQQAGGGGSTWSYVNETQEGSASSRHNDAYSAETTSTTTASLKKSGRRSPTPLLSVVADTLQQQQNENQNTPNRSNITTTGDTGTAMPDLRFDQAVSQQQPPIASLARMHEHFDDDDDDDHEDDPIFSLLRKESMHATDSNKESASSSNDVDRNRKQLLASSSNHSTGHRFMDDLEKRMNSSDQNIESFIMGNSDDAGEKPQQQQQQQQSASTSTTSTGPFKNGPFGGYFMNLAVSSANKMLNRPPTTSGSASNVTSPPLARTKKTKSNIQNKDDDDIEYNVTASTSVLSASELKQLKESSTAIKNGGGKFSLGALYDSLYSNRRFVFIFGTFLLTLIVYWYLSQTVRSDLQ